MTQLRSVNYICLVCKFKFLFLGNIYHRSIAILFGTVFFSSFWRLWKLIFWQKLFQNLIFVFFLSEKQQNWFEKNFDNSGVVGHRKLPNPLLSAVFNLLPIGLRYIVSYKWSNFGPKCLVTGQLPKFKGQRPKGQPPNFKATPWELFQFLKQAVSTTWHADSNLVIIMKLKKKIEYSWVCTFWTSQCFKGYRNLPFAWDGVRYDKL